jgi:hypothetical protein
MIEKYPHMLDLTDFLYQQNRHKSFQTRYKKPYQIPHQIIVLSCAQAQQNSPVQIYSELKTIGSISKISSKWSMKCDSNNQQQQARRNCITRWYKPEMQ